MAFQQGLSGLNAASRALDVTSNNVANSATVGFKSASTHFADVFAASIGSGGASQVGIGATVGAIQQQFTQGNVTSTNNPLDISINGGGFFRMSDNGTVTYSRNGQFHLDKDGYVIDDLSRHLTGYGVDAAGTINTAAATDLQLSSASIDPVATGPAGDPAAGVTASLNFDSRSVVPTVAFNKGTPSSYNFSTATTIYDSLGNAHSLTLYAVKVSPPAIVAATTADNTAATTLAAAIAADATASTPATVAAIAAATAAKAVTAAALAAANSATYLTTNWTIYSSVDGTDPAFAGSPGTLTFDLTGKLVTGSGVLTASVNLSSVMAAQKVPQTNSALTPLTFDLNFADSTQFGAAFGTNNIQQNGYTSGRLTGVSVGSDGIVKGNYSNGKSRNLGEVVLCNFTNPNGLTSLGGNQWAETSESGTPQMGAPNTGTLGVLQASAVEESNVDLTAELVNMITEQRNYQANAQSIKTQDQIMQTLVNLR